MMWLLLAQLAVWQPVVAPTLHQGYWRSCNGEERVLEHRVNGYLAYEIHLGPADQFALYNFRVADGEHSHEGPLNLLGTPQADSLQTYRGARQWAVPSLHLWISVVRAGDAPAGCDAFFIKVVKQ